MAIKNSIKSLVTDKEKRNRIGSETVKKESIGSLNLKTEAANKVMSGATNFQEYTTRRNAVRTDLRASYTGHQNPSGLTHRNAKGDLKNGFTMPNKEGKFGETNTNVRRGTKMSEASKTELQNRELKTSNRLLNKDVNTAKAAYAAKMEARREMPAKVGKAAGVLGTAYAVGQAIGSAYVAGRQAYDNYANNKEADRLEKVAKKKKLK